MSNVQAFSVLNQEGRLTYGWVMNSGAADDHIRCRDSLFLGRVIWFSQSQNFLGGTYPKTNLVPAIPFPRIIYIVLK